RGAGARDQRGARLPRRGEQRAADRLVRRGGGERARLPGPRRGLCGRRRGRDRGRGGDRGGGLGRPARAARAAVRAVDARPGAAARLAEHRPAGRREAGSALDGEIRDGRHIMPVRVYYEDTDFSGVVYHANYLRFMERGRTNFLRLLGADQRGLFEEVAKEAPGFAFVVRSMTLGFLCPSLMDDVLPVTTGPAEVKGASITLHQTVARGDDILVEAQVRVAFVSGGRARPIPKALRIAMRADAPPGG